MYLPNYKDGSIVNLMSSLAHGLGGKSNYKDLAILSSREIKQSKNVILIVIDGMGYDFLIRNTRSKILKENLRGKMTSVFPSTTASAMTCYLTGVSPNEHGLTGWFVQLKELGGIAAVLPFVPRGGGADYGSIGADAKNIFDVKPFCERIKCDSYAVMPTDVLVSDFNKVMFSRSRVAGYTNMKSFFQALNYIVGRKGQKYIHAYWPGIDYYSHRFGKNHKKTNDHFAKLEKKLDTFLRSLKGTDSTVIISADHGIIDCPLSRRIDIDKHPKLRDCMSMALSGEPRVGYFYIHPNKAREFERYVAQKLGYAGELYRSKEIVDKHFYGFGKEHPKLRDRVGDYILIMKQNYSIKDFVLGELDKKFIGQHGGVSVEEMHVPVIVVKG